MAKSATPHILVEIDGDEMAITAAEVCGKTSRVRSSRRDSFVGWGGALHDEVRQAMRDVGFASASVHVVMDSKGFAAFELNLPRLKADELTRVVEREARHRLAHGDDAPALVGIGKGRQLPNKLSTYPVVALSSEALTVLNNCIEDPLLRVRKIVRREDALALVLADHLPSCVVCLRRQRGGLQCELVENSTLKSGRRIELDDWTPGEPPSEELLGILKLEIDRTLEYFADLGLTAPEALAIDPSVGLTEWLSSGVVGDHPVVDLHFDDGQHGSELDEPVPPATLGLLRHLAGVAEVIAIEVQPPEPVVANVHVMAGAIGLLLAVSSAGVVTFGRDLKGAERELGELRRRAAELREEQVQLELRGATGDESVGVDAELHALVLRRRPVSRLVAEVSNLVPRTVFLDDISFDAEDRIRISGTVRSTSRLEAIRVLEGFKASLGGVSFLSLEREEVSYDATEGSQSVTFLIEGRWR